MPLLRRTKITLLQNEIVQNKPGSAIREGGPRRRVSHALRATTWQLLKTADKPVLQHKPIISPRKLFRQGETPLQEFRNKKFPATQEYSLRTIFFGNSSGSLIRARYFSLALRTLCSVLKPYQWKPEPHPILGKCSLWAGSTSSVILRESTI